MEVIYPPTERYLGGPISNSRFMSWNNQPFARRIRGPRRPETGEIAAWFRRHGIHQKPRARNLLQIPGSQEFPGLLVPIICYVTY